MPPDETSGRRALTRARIVDTALQVVERHGLPALSMRRVANELGVTPMSLYNHVADRAEMIDLMVDYILAGVAVEAARPGPDDEWPVRLAELARAWRRAWGGHPGFARVYSDGVSLGPNGLAGVEHVVGLLRRAGFADRDAAEAFFLLYRYVVSSLLVAPARPVDLDGHDGRSDGSGPDRLEKYFSALSSDEIPNVVAAASHLGGGDFDFGLEILVSGLRAQLAARAPQRGGPTAGVAP